MIAMTALLLVLHLDEPGDVRLASSGTDGVPVTWSVGGQPSATTWDGAAATIHLGEGTHELWASSAVETEWLAMARADRPDDGLGYASAATARSEAREADHGWTPWTAAALAAAAAVVVTGGTRRRRN